MKHMQKVLSVLLLLALCCGLFAACADGGTSSQTESQSSSSQSESQPQSETVEKTAVRVGLIKGPTGIGAVQLWDKSDKGETINDYTFSLAAAPTDMVSRVAAGEVDIAALPTNTASALYHKTGGNVQILALNTEGVLYILENGNTIQQMSDLKGKTIYANGQGANPEYVLNYLLRENGLTPGEDVTIEFRDADELATLMAAGEIDVCMLPVPNVTSVLMKNSDVRAALDLTEEWNALDNGSILTMGCVVVRREFAEENPEAVAAFVEEYRESIEAVAGAPEAASTLVEKYEITGSAAIAKAAIPDCNLICITGADIQAGIEGYYKVLLDADPTSIGGELPGDDFYYTAE